jgi:hypothetical protein
MSDSESTLSSTSDVYQKEASAKMQYDRAMEAAKKARALGDTGRPVERAARKKAKWLVASAKLAKSRRLGMSNQGGMGSQGDTGNQSAASSSNQGGTGNQGDTGNQSAGATYAEKKAAVENNVMGGIFEAMARIEEKAAKAKQKAAAKEAKQKAKAKQKAAAKATAKRSRDIDDGIYDEADHDYSCWGAGKSDWTGDFRSLAIGS